MLGRYYYHQIFRKSIIAFGTIFNNIIIKRRGSSSTLEALKVPIQYGPYQKFLAMIAAEPTPERQGVQITLPRMSFEIKGLTYDSARKMAPTTFSKSLPAAGTDQENKPVQYKQYLPVPYNLDVELSIMTKTQDDGLQIIEQILPAFHPSINVSIEVIDETHEERDIAIVLNNINYQDDYEGDFSERRTLIWTLNFTVKTYLFGPVDVQRDIRKAIVDYRTDIVQRNTELRYTAEVQSTDVPPVPRDEINPETDNYKVVETYEDLYAQDNDFFGLNP
ncbi:tail completion protein [Synechococcus phage S-B68]|nr:tail completion protein [Synechococcus phage S-B68]